MNYYIAITTRDAEWEIVQGIHLIEAKSHQEAQETVKEIVKGERVISVTKVEDTMRSNSHSVSSGRLKTLVDTSEM